MYNSKEQADNDARWGLLNKQLIEYANSNDWGLYRNTRLEMAEILQKEKRFNEALRTYLEICYIDLNGPNNVGVTKDPKILIKYPPFDPSQGFLAPGIVDSIQEIIKDLDLSKNEVKQIFVEHNLRTGRSLKLPHLPEPCWVLLDKELGG